MARVNRISTNFKNNNREVERVLYNFKITKEEFYQLETYRKFKEFFSDDTVERYFDDYLEFIKFRVLLGLKCEPISNKEIELYKKILERRGMSKRNIKTKITRAIRYFYFMDLLDSKYLNGEKLKDEPLGKKMFLINNK